MQLLAIFRSVLTILCMYILFVFRKTSRGSHQTNILPPAVARDKLYYTTLDD